MPPTTPTSDHLPESNQEKTSDAIVIPSQTQLSKYEKERSHSKGLSHPEPPQSSAKYRSQPTREPQVVDYLKVPSFGTPSRRRSSKSRTRSRTPLRGESTPHVSIENGKVATRPPSQDAERGNPRGRLMKSTDASTASVNRSFKIYHQGMPAVAPAQRLLNGQSTVIFPGRSADNEGEFDKHTQPHYPTSPQIPSIVISPPVTPATKTPKMLSPLTSLVALAETTTQTEFNHAYHYTTRAGRLALDDGNSTEPAVVGSNKVNRTPKQDTRIKEKGKVQNASNLGKILNRI